MTESIVEKELKGRKIGGLVLLVVIAMYLAAIPVIIFSISRENTFLTILCILCGALGWILGIAIVVIAAFPMALLGIIPQSVVADVAEAEGVVTGENREGMFFAARTFAMKFGQSLALILFTSLSLIGGVEVEGELVPSVLGLLFVAIVAIAFCVLGAVILMFYREKHIMKLIAKEGDEAFMKAIENEKE